MKLYKWYKCSRQHGWPTFNKDRKTISNSKIRIEEDELILVLEIMPRDLTDHIAPPSTEYIKILHKGKLGYIFFDTENAQHINWWLIQS